MNISKNTSPLQPHTIRPKTARETATPRAHQELTPTQKDGRIIQADRNQPEAEIHVRPDRPGRLFELPPEAGMAPDRVLGPKGGVQAGLFTDGGLKPLHPGLKLAEDPDWARKKIDELMQGYDWESSDADDIAQQIAGSQEMLNELTVPEREKLVMGLFDGPTHEDEEDAAMMILLVGTTKSELFELVDRIGWDRLDDELDSHDMSLIQQRLTS